MPILWVDKYVKAEVAVYPIYTGSNFTGQANLLS